MLKTKLLGLVASTVLHAATVASKYHLETDL